MSALAGLIGILAVTAITPGPNNLIVMNAGAQRGPGAAAGAIAGVIAGSVALYAVIALVWSGMSARMPLLAVAAGWLSAAYLAWLGILLFGKRNGDAGSTAFYPASPAAIAFFQVVNPKAWGLMGAMAAGAQAGVDRWLLVPVMIVVMAGCLTLWAAGGILLSRSLEDDRRRRRFNRVMGACLIVLALTLPDWPM